MRLWNHLQSSIGGRLVEPARGDVEGADNREGVVTSWLPQAAAFLTGALMCAPSVAVLALNVCSQVLRCFA